MQKNNSQITLHKKIWCKIRYYQQLNDISDELLARYMGVSERTMREYDKDARTLTLEKVERFLSCFDMNSADLFED